MLRFTTKFLNLTNEERILLLKTFFLLKLVRLGLWVYPYGRLLQFLDKVSLSFSQNYKVTQQVNKIELTKITWAINLSSSYSFGEVKCLAKALTTKVIMINYGYSPQLHIGVALKSGRLEAHAWVENEGEVIIGYLRDLSRFSQLKYLKKKQ